MKLNRKLYYCSLFLFCSFYWMFDSIWSYISFEKNLSVLIFSEPMSYLDTIMLKIPPSQIVSRITVIVLFLTGGILILKYLKKNEKAEAELREKDRFRENLLNRMMTFVAILDPSGEIIFVNNPPLAVRGILLDDIIGMKFFDAPWWTHSAEVQETIKRDIKECTSGKSVVHDVQIQTADGTLMWIEFSMRPIYDEHRNLQYLIPEGRDITDRKQAEEQIKASLKEKQTLLDEIHHRVKNNMNIVSSLLKLQSNNIENDQIKDILKASQDRVYAMSAVHETLHGTENLSEIDLKSYLSKITTSIFQAYSTDNRKVKLNSDVDNSLISLNQAYPLGLTINELISNSLKYAFPANRTGEVTVNLKKLDKELELIVIDDGVGIPEKLDWKNSNTLGLKLVRTLVENQLDGSIDLDNTNGTRFTIKFNIDETPI